ncbi:O-antigen ligase family protein [Devosia ginsengisoli]|nr:O-antigen ligase family protein [Devosia ginsengisoli]
MLLIAIAAAILPPGYPAYVGAYISLAIAFLALLCYGRAEWSIVKQPTSTDILIAIALVTATVPFVYRSEADLFAPVLLLPMLTTIALGLLARPANWIPSPSFFAWLCLLSSLIALLGGAYEHFVLGVHRPGLGNNPIHYGSLAAMIGGLALVGVVYGTSPRRYLFLLGPVFGLAAAMISDSRGPMVGAMAITIVGLVILLFWLWRERFYRYSMLASLAAGIGFVAWIGTGSNRIAHTLDSALNIFRFTGGPDDIRAALYTSAVEVLKTSPIVGVGLGQIMDTAQVLFPGQPETHTLDNLHADWANFAAMGGSFGLLAWILLLAAPLMLLANARVRQDRPIVLGAILLFVGQFTLGISNATFGILPQTTVYAVSLGYFLARARRLALTTPTKRLERGA